MRDFPRTVTRHKGQREQVQKTEPTLGNYVSKLSQCFFCTFCTCVNVIHKFFFKSQARAARSLEDENRNQRNAIIDGLNAKHRLSPTQ